MSAVVVHAIIRLAACFVAKQICRKRKNESVDNRQIVVDWRWRGHNCTHADKCYTEEGLGRERKHGRHIIGSATSKTNPILPSWDVYRIHGTSPGNHWHGAAFAFVFPSVARAAGCVHSSRRQRERWKNGRASAQQLLSSFVSASDSLSNFRDARMKKFPQKQNLVLQEIEPFIQSAISSLPFRWCPGRGQTRADRVPGGGQPLPLPGKNLTNTNLDWCWVDSDSQEPWIDSFLLYVERLCWKIIDPWINSLL